MHAGGSPCRLRLGIIGCGRVFERYYLPALSMHSHWGLAAVCEPLRERREWAQQACPGVPAFESVARLLEEPRLDAVVIATPPITHASLAAQALEAGLHVLVEKPMATQLADGRALLELSQRARNRLWVGFNRRFVDIYLRMKDQCAAISEEHIRGISMRLIINPSAWNPVGASLGGAPEIDVLDDLASHQLDLLPWLADAAVTAVRVRTAQPEGRQTTVEYDVRLDTGLEARCEIAYGDRYVETVECVLNDRALHARDCRHLDVRRAWIGGLRGLPLPRVIASLSRRRARPGNPVRESFDRQLGAFASAARGESSHPRMADAGDGFAVMRAVAACRQSIESGGSWIPVT